MGDAMRSLQRVLRSIPGCEIGDRMNRHGRPVYFNGRRVGMIARKDGDPRALKNVVMALRREGVPVRLLGAKPVLDEDMYRHLVDGENRPGPGDASTSPSAT